MQASEFKQIALNLYGDGWSHKLAAALKINRRTVRDYAKGIRQIPEPIAIIMQFWADGANRG